MDWYFGAERKAGRRSPLVALLALGLATVLGAALPLADDQRALGAAAPAQQVGAPRAEDLETGTAGDLRFYTPNLIAAGATGTPPRDTNPEQIDWLFSDAAAMTPLLGSVDVYSFFGASVARADGSFEAMLARAIPMLQEHGVKLGLEVGGPLGYAPPTVYGGDTDGQNGVNSALLDLGPSRIGKIERLGGVVDYLMLDGALRRTIRNGEHSAAHAAYVTMGGGNGRLRFTAAVRGADGNAISVEYAAGAPGAGLSVSVSGTAITVHLATDSLGATTSTAADVQAAVQGSAAASALVSAALPSGSTGSGRVGPTARVQLAYGDDGLNMTIQQSVAEVVAYVRTIHAARSNIRFVLLEDTILWPYDGVAGYQSASYPDNQRPDFKQVWDELIAQLDAAGLRSLLVGMHNDHPIEYPERLIRSINRDADDWYGRTLRLQEQVEADGVAFAQLFNSVWGGDPGQDATHASPFASDEYFQQRVLDHVSRLESHRLAYHPGLAQSRHFAFDAFMYYPRVVSPATTEHSTDDTYLEALALFESFATELAAVADDIHPPVVSFARRGKVERRRIPLWVRWAEPDTGGVGAVQLQRRVDGGSWLDVAQPPAGRLGVRLQFAFNRRYELRVRAVDDSQSPGPWLVGQPFVVMLHDQTDPAIVASEAWRELSSLRALGGTYDRTLQRGAEAQLSFSGTQVAWIGHRGPRHGIARVYLDGVRSADIELRAPRTRWRKLLYASPRLPDNAVASIVVRSVAPEWRPRVDVDAFVVLRVDSPSP